MTWREKKEEKKTTPNCKIATGGVSLFLRNSSVWCHVQPALFVRCAFLEYFERVMSGNESQSVFFLVHQKITQHCAVSSRGSF